MIHPTAVISPDAKIGANVKIGPYTIIEDNAVIGDDCKIGPHVHISGDTTIGKNVEIHAGAIIGDTPQDLSYNGAPSKTIIGDNCILREYVTIHRGAPEGSATILGDNVMLMAFVHIGHNCEISNNVIMANNATVAGHVHVGERAFISGSCLVHQFVHIGRMAMLGGGCRIRQDVPPFCMLQFDVIYGPNIVGLRRAGISPNGRKQIRKAIKEFFFSHRQRPEILAEFKSEMADIPEVQEFVTFVEESQRGITPGSDKPGHE